MRKGYHHLRKEQVKAIRKMSKRKSQKEIADALGIHRNSVYRYQALLGLHARHQFPAAAETQIVELLKTPMSFRNIAEQTGASEHFVRLIRIKHNVVHPSPGFIPMPVRVKLDDEIKNHRNYLCDLAPKLGVGYKTVNKRAHKILGVTHFRPGRTPQPLSSNFPERNFDVTEPKEPSDYLKIVSRVCDRYAGGRLPDVDDAVFVAGLVSVFAHLDSFRSAPQVSRDLFFLGLLDATRTLRASQCALKN